MKFLSLILNAKLESIFPDITGLQRYMIRIGDCTELSLPVIYVLKWLWDLKFIVQALCKHGLTYCRVFRFYFLQRKLILI